MHENEVRDLSLVKDARSKPHNEDLVWILNGILALLFCSGMQNIISQLGYLNIGVDAHRHLHAGALELKFFIWLAFHLLLWFFVFYKLKHLYYCILNQKNDILLIRNTSASFYFRFENNRELQEISHHVLEDKNSKSSRVVWGLFLVALWFSCGLIFLKKIPFWFVSKDFANSFGLQNFDAYIAYRAQDLGLLQLFADGFISVVVATTIIGIVLLSILLSILLIVIILFLPIGIAKWVLSKIGVGSTSPLTVEETVEETVDKMTDEGYAYITYATLLLMSFMFLIWFPLCLEFQLDKFEGRYLALLYIPYGVIISCIFILVVHFIRRRKNKNHEE
jgi:hypothetical protein